MRIALIGTRGVPANYGGFETCAEELSVKLVERGHDVTVFCKPGNVEGEPSSYKGVRLVYTRGIETKTLGTISRTGTAMLTALRGDFDVFLVFNSANAPLCLVAHRLHRRVVINVDGLDWKRRKWGWLARRYYKWCERLSPLASDRVISDARAIQRYYLNRYGASTTYVAYGAYPDAAPDPTVPARYGLEPRRYFIVGSRLEPENNGDLTVAAFARVETDMKLVIAGGANWDSPYVRALERAADGRVVFTGHIPHHEVEQLNRQSYGYVHGNEVGGTGPALLEALASGTCVFALDNPFNAEVVGDAAILYRKDPDDLADKLRLALDEPATVAGYRARGPQRIREAYSWDAVATGYEQLLERVIDGYYDTERASD